MLKLRAPSPLDGVGSGKVTDAGFQAKLLRARESFLLNDLAFKMYTAKKVKLVPYTLLK